MAKEDDILSALVEAGAMISDDRKGMVLLPIHAELIGVAPNRQLYYVQAGAEDQHHTHAIPFDKADVVYDRDLALRQQNGRIVAYVAPIIEWPEIDVDATREAFALAKRYLATHPEYFKSFCEFVDDCRPLLSEAQASLLSQ